MAEPTQAEDLVHVVSPDGQLGTVPRSMLLAATKEGYRLPNVAQSVDAQTAKESDDPLAAGVASAGRALTFGASDKLLSAAGMAPQELSNLKQQNPKADLAGEVAGTAAGILTGAGAPGLISKVGMAAEGAAASRLGLSALGKIGAKAAAGIAEGGLYGVGNTLSEASLGDTDLTAQKLVANAGLGALFGGAGGAALETLGMGLSKAAGIAKDAVGLDGQTLKGALQDFAEKRAVSAGGNMAKEMKGLQYRGQLNERGRVMIDHGLLGSLDDIAEGAGIQKKAINERRGELLKAFDAHAQPGEMVSGPAIADKIHSELVSPLLEGNAADQQVAKRMAHEAEIIRSKGEMSLVDANKYKNSFDPYLEFNAEQRPVQEKLKQVSGIMNGAIEDSAESIGARTKDFNPDAFSEWKEAKRLFGHFKEIEETASQRSAAMMANRMASASDNGLGAAAFLGSVAHGAGGPASMAAGVATGALNKMVRKYGDTFMARGADALANSSLIERLSGGFAKDVAAKLESNPEAFGPYSGLISGAAARSPAELLATHIKLSESDPSYRDMAAIAGYADESSSDVPAIATRAARLEAVHAAIDMHDQKTESAIGRFLGKQGGAVPQLESGQPVGADKMKAYEARLDALSKLVSDPQHLVSTTNPGGLADIAPNTAAASTAIASNAANFLHQMAPKNPNGNPIKALEGPWKPSADDLTKWDRYVRTVDNPMTVLHDLKKGIVTSESVEAMRAVYPKMLQDMQDRMMNRLTGYEGTLNNRQRQAIMSLFGAMGGQENAAVFQQVHAQAAAQKAAQEQHAMAGSQLKSDNLATQSQRIEGR